jgi:hypothetical protein
MPTDGKLHFDESENWVIGPEDADKIATFVRGKGMDNLSRIFSQFRSRYTDLYPG